MLLLRSVFLCFNSQIFLFFFKYCSIHIKKLHSIKVTKNLESILFCGLLICTFDSDFRKVGQFTTFEKSQVLGTISFFQFCTHYFFQVCRPIFSYAKKMEIQVLDRNTMCIWSHNMMKQRVFYLWEFLILFIWNECTK